jgi:hypothetical protein
MASGRRRQEKASRSGVVWCATTDDDEHNVYAIDL